MKAKLSTVALACIAGGLMSSQALAADFSAVLSTSTTQLSASDDVVVTLTVTNQERKPQRILKWYTAQDGVKEALFSVERDGKPLMYLGAHYKRPAPTADDYLILKSGESVSWQVDLSSHYDMTQTGDYKITFDVESLNLYEDTPAIQPRGGLVGHDVASSEIDSLESNTLQLWIEGNPERRVTIPPLVDYVNAGSVSYSGSCSNSEKSAISSGLSAASSMANNSVSYLQNNGAGSTRYDTWFGSYNSSRWNTVKSNFTSIKDAIDNKPLVFDCSCNDSYFAYVYPSQPYKIYLCNAYWSASTSGTDSKGGTIIHELSHFNAVAGTDDIVYGQSGAKRLADRNPKRAIKNADSHEYFAENTPYQN